MNVNEGTTVSALAAHTDAPEPPPRWDTLFAADDDGLAELRALADLNRWVRWLIDRYDLGDTLPACWAQHPGAVEELAALPGLPQLG